MKQISLLIPLINLLFAGVLIAAPDVGTLNFDPHEPHYATCADIFLEESSDLPSQTKGAEALEPDDQYVLPKRFYDVAYDTLNSRKMHNFLGSSLVYSLVLLPIMTFKFMRARANVGGVPDAAAVQPAAGRLALLWTAVAETIGIVVSPYLVTEVIKGDVSKGVESVKRSVGTRGREFLSSLGILPAGPPEVMWDPFLELEAMRARFDEVKSDLEPDVLRAVADRMTNFEREAGSKDTSGYSSGRDSNDVRKQRMELKKMDVLMRLPSRVKELKFTPDTRDALDALLSPYSKDVRDRIVRFTAGIEMGSKVSSGQRSTIYFAGSSGTGKTYLARRYAEVLGLPLIEIDLQKIDSIEKFTGGKSYSWSQQEAESLSALTKAFSQLPEGKRYKNAIVLIEGLDKFLDKVGQSAETKTVEAFLVSLLDPFSKTLPLGDIKINIDTSHLIFIFTGRSPPPAGKVPGNISLPTVLFGSFSMDKRVELACRHFKSVLNGDKAAPEQLNAIIAGAKADQKLNIGIGNLFATITDYRNHLALKSSTFQVTDEFDFVRELEAKSGAETDPLFRIHMLNERYRERQECYSSSFQALIQNQLKKLLAQAGNQGNQDRRHQHQDEPVEDPFAKLESVLELPCAVKIWADPSAAIARVESALRLYPKDLRDSVATIAANHMTFSTAGNLIDPSPNKRSIVYFHGAAGAGKSYLSRQIADALGLPLYVLDFSTGPGKVSLVGTGKEPGLLTKSLTVGTPRVRNGIIWMNEIDKILNSTDTEVKALKMQLLTFLDPDGPKMLKLDDLDVEIDTSRYLFLLVGNDLIMDANETNKRRSPLNDRMQLLHFTGFEPSARREIIPQLFHKLTRTNGTEENDEDFEIVEALVRADIELKNTSLRPVEKTITTLVGDMARKQRKDALYYVEQLRKESANPMQGEVKP